SRTGGRGWWRWKRPWASTGIASSPTAWWSGSIVSAPARRRRRWRTPTSSPRRRWPAGSRSGWPRGRARAGSEERRMKPAAKLNELGQSTWLDLIGRKLIRSGELKRMIEEDGIRGVTANPAIFEKAIVETDEYDEALKKLIEQGRSPMEIYE